MPEGPEVRRYADELSKALTNKPIVEICARTKNAKAWLASHGEELVGKRIERIFAHGKNVICIIEGKYYFYSHQMMWGKWQVLPGAPPTDRDRRERARIVVPDATALLMSAPVFEIGAGDPYKQIEFLKQLGPNVLPYPGEKFDKTEFLRRLNKRANRWRTIGDVLLDQTVCAGIGNYLRAEILFIARLNPWKLVSEMSELEKQILAKQVAATCKASYEIGFTVKVEERARMAIDNSLVYVPGKEYGTRHYVFRRTNLPCLVCSEPIKQMRQLTTNLSKQDEDDGEERTRIVYFCAFCQKVDVQAVKLPFVRRGTA